MVVLDDEEGTHTQFSYDKYFGIKEPSDRDLKNIQEGKETAVDRTRRLFYVCCTRALEDLVVVLFSHDPAHAEVRVRAMNLFEDANVLTSDILPQMIEKLLPHDEETLAGPAFQTSPKVS